MKLLGAWLVFLVHTPLYWITRVTPRRRDLWVFGAWFGDEYSDNSRYLAEHVRREHPSVTCVWLCRSREVVERAKEDGLDACLMFSLRGYWYSARASVGFICTGRFDINFFVRPTTVINLWHGIPLEEGRFRRHGLARSDGEAFAVRHLPALRHSWPSADRVLAARSLDHVGGVQAPR